MTRSDQPLRFSRRQALQAAACGFGSLALAGLSADKLSAATQLMHHAPRAKRVIFLFMAGGVSQVDSFDHKPILDRLDNQMVEFVDARKQARGEAADKHRIMKPLWKFRQYGECGHWASDLFPNVAQHVDDLCFIHSMHTEGVAPRPGDTVSAYWFDKSDPPLDGELGHVRAGLRESESAGVRFALSVAR